MISKVRIQFHPNYQVKFEDYLEESLLNAYEGKYNEKKGIILKERMNRDLVRIANGVIFIERIPRGMSIDIAQKFVNRMEFLTGHRTSNFEICGEAYFIKFE